MVRIAIQGVSGRMGQVLLGLIAQREDCRVVAGIDPHAPPAVRGNEFPLFAGIDEMNVAADVLIDFSHPEATKAALPFCAAKGLPCVVCTTGLDEETMAVLHQAAAKTAVFRSANMSLGVNLMAELARRAQAALPGFDIEIIEKHHHNKLDAPSGTALLLADEINQEARGRYHYMYDRHPLRQKRDPDEIGLHAVRGGSIVGEHEVLFAGPDEVFSLHHSALSRDVFASGAVAAALFLAGKAPGLYTMKDLMAAL